MKRNKFRRNVNDQLISPVEDEIVDDDPDEIVMRKASADYYERSWKRKIKEQKGDWLIAVGLYLILASVAFVTI